MGSKPVQQELEEKRDQVTALKHEVNQYQARLNRLENNLKEVCLPLLCFRLLVLFPDDPVAFFSLCSRLSSLSHSLPMFRAPERDQVP